MSATMYPQQCVSLVYSRDVMLIIYSFIHLLAVNIRPNPQGEVDPLQEMKADCYTSQLKYVFRLEDNVSRVVGEN